MEDIRVNVNNTQQNSEPPIIKVVGVGGGGGNAVNYMYGLKVPNVTYLLCNTDQQHLNRCDVPNTICIGRSTSKGLGAGNKPEVAKEAALESTKEVQEALSDGTHMAFITAGMGGGTGTGAAPVIAKIAKDLGILTVGIVTIPFLFEGRTKILRAIKGVEELRKNVDAILVVKNQLLRTIYPDLSMTDAFKKADETLTTSTRSISEMITFSVRINADFADVKTTLKDGGVSIITRGFASKEEGIKVAIQRALESPLIDTKDFERAKKVLIQIHHRPGCEPTMVETDMLHSHITSKLTTDFDLIWGMGVREDDDMLDDLCFTLLASGFAPEDIYLNEYYNKHRSEEEQEREEKEDEMIRNWYEDYQPAGMGRVRYQTVIFSDEELDNDSFIATIIETPTLLRKGNEVREFRAKKVATTHQPTFAPQPEAPRTTPTAPSSTPATPPNDGIERSDEVITF